MPKILQRDLSFIPEIMDTMLQRHCAKHIYIVPDGLKELMSDISREVLRSHPVNIYSFIADYLDALIITRENARVATKLVQSISEITTTTCSFLKDTGISRQEADRIVAIIRKTFKQHLRECPVGYSSDDKFDDLEEANIVSNIIDEAEISPGIGEEAARIIQHAYRNYKQRREKEKELLNGMVDWRVAARSAIRLYRKTGVTTEEAKRAATLIKAAYKGYYTRRIMKVNALKDIQIEEKKIDEIADEDTKSITKSERSVRINYDTVIPHVGFDDFDNIDNIEFKKKELVESTTSVVIADVIEVLLEQTRRIVEIKQSNEVNVLLLQEDKGLDEEKIEDGADAENVSSIIILDDTFIENHTEDEVDDAVDDKIDI